MFNTLKSPDYVVMTVGTHPSFIPFKKSYFLIQKCRNIVFIITKYLTYGDGIVRIRNV